jgi:hypothetical protein
MICYDKIKFNDDVSNEADAAEDGTMNPVNILQNEENETVTQDEEKINSQEEEDQDNRIEDEVTDLEDYQINEDEELKIKEDEEDFQLPCDPQEIKFDTPVGQRIFATFKEAKESSRKKRQTKKSQALIQDSSS